MRSLLIHLFLPCLNSYPDQYYRLLNENRSISWRTLVLSLWMNDWTPITEVTPDANFPVYFLKIIILFFQTFLSFKFANLP